MLCLLSPMFMCYICTNPNAQAIIDLGVLVCNAVYVWSHSAHIGSIIIILFFLGRQKRCFKTLSDVYHILYECMFYSGKIF